MPCQDYGASTRDALEGTLGRLLDLLRMYAQRKDPSAFFMAWVKQSFTSSPADRKVIGKTMAFASLAHGRKKGRPANRISSTRYRRRLSSASTSISRMPSASPEHSGTISKKITRYSRSSLSSSRSTNPFMPSWMVATGMDMKKYLIRESGMMRSSAVFSRGNRKRSGSSNLPKNSTTMSLPRPKNSLI